MLLAFGRPRAQARSGCREPNPPEKSGRAVSALRLPSLTRPSRSRFAATCVRKKSGAARSRLTDQDRAASFSVAPRLSRRGQPACACGVFFQKTKNRLLQRFAYAICPLRRDVRIASGRRASLPALTRGFDGLRRVEQRARWRKKARKRLNTILMVSS